MAKKKKSSKKKSVKKAPRSNRSKPANQLQYPRRVACHRHRRNRQSTPVMMTAKKTTYPEFADDEDWG